MKNEETIVSIIMPVYNSEASLRRSIDSFVGQSFKDWELIVVNDGSTDKSLSIIADYASQDSRIKVINKPNGGVASARQAGMDSMVGQYFIHADSDDWVEPTMLEEMIKKANEDSSAIVIADYFVEHANGKSKIVFQKPKLYKAIDVLYAIYARELFGGLCHKLIKKSAYDKAQARFIHGIDYCEDVLLLTQILSNQDLKISYINKAFYHYVLSEGSLTRAITPRGFESIQKFTELLPSILPKESRFTYIIEKSRLDLFLAGFMNRIYSIKEIKSEYQKVKALALSTESLRWKLGYYCIGIGWYGMAHKLIQF